MTSTEAGEVPLELERLHRSVDFGFAITRSDLALLLNAPFRPTKAFDGHEARIEALERARPPLPSLAAAHHAWR